MDLPLDLTPLDGGFSGETFAADLAGQRVAVRIYAGRSRVRGPSAVDIDATLLRWMRGIVPVAEVLEVRRPVAELPGLLITELLPGVRADLLLPRLDATQRATLGVNLGRVLDRLRHVPTLAAGTFSDALLRIVPFSVEDGVPGWVEAQVPALTSWAASDLRALGRVADRAQDLLDTIQRTCLVHGDLNSKNLLVDPRSLAVTGVLDWEFAHSGTPFADLGNLLRFERDQTFVEAVLSGLGVAMDDPGERSRTLALAQAADLVALVDLTARDHDPGARNPATEAAQARLLELVRVG